MRPLYLLPAVALLLPFIGGGMEGPPKGGPYAHEESYEESYVVSGFSRTNLQQTATQRRGTPPDVLPPVATSALARSLGAAAAHVQHVWRDTAPLNADGTVNAYIEIARGDRRKWEFDIGANRRAIDRMIPAEIGGYPVNYGFVPQTVSYDGDPFDALLLGAPVGGRLVRGAIVGVMFMADEKGLDSKVVLSPVDRDGQPTLRLTSALQREIGGYFARYKQNQPGAFSTVDGWGTAAEGLAHVETTHEFFRRCRDRANAPCDLTP